MNTTIVNPIDLDAFDLLQGERNSLLQPQGMFLVEVINFDENINDGNYNHSLVAITSYQDCVELIILGPCEKGLKPKQLVMIAKLLSSKQVLNPVYLDNQLCNLFYPTVEMELFPNKEGMMIHRVIFDSKPPFMSYSIL